MKKCPSCGFLEVDKGVLCGCTIIEKEAAATLLNISSPPPLPTPHPLWEPQGNECLSCGAPNPNDGDVCGNCGEDPKKIPGILTKNQLTILQSAKLPEAS